MILVPSERLLFGVYYQHVGISLSDTEPHLERHKHGKNLLFFPQIFVYFVVLFYCSVLCALL